jgi:PASTA domain/Beta-propeller repeat
MRTRRIPARLFGVALLAVTATGVLLQLGPIDTSRALTTRARSASTRQQTLTAYAKLPLAFTVNAGQTDRRVRYSARGAGFAVFLTRREAVLVLQSGRQHSAEGGSLALRFLGASRNVAIHADHAAKGRVNYLLGNDPGKWRTGLRTYQRVVYRELWPGIDLAFHGRSGKLKYEFLVRPRAHVTDIRLAYRGAKRLFLDGAGNLTVRTPTGALTDQRPLSYQLVDGRRVPVASRFVLERGYRLGFAIGRGYDRRYPLVIDPGLVYSSYLGGGGDDSGDGGIAVDGAGNAYVTGETASMNFPTTPGTLDTNLGGPTDAFVTKLDASGAALVYSTYLGGISFERGMGIAVEGAGSAYVTGTTTSTDFPTTSGAFDTTYNDAGDVFVMKLDPSGAALGYSTYLGGGGSDQSNSIALDSAGDAYLTGTTIPRLASPNFPTTPGAFDATLDGPVDAFVTKLDSSGATLGYSTYLGGSITAFFPEYGSGIAVDADGSAFVTGQTGSPDFPTTAGAFDTTLDGPVDAFVTKLSATGAALGYSTYLGGSGNDHGDGIALDSAGSAYVTGQTDSTQFPTTAGAFDTTLGGPVDVFVTKLNASGAALAYSSYLGGSVAEGFFPGGIAVDGPGSAYLTGFTTSSDFPTTPGAFDTSRAGPDGFVTKLDASGRALLYSTFLGGSGGDHASSIAIDSAGNAHVAGTTSSVDFPTTSGALDTTLDGSGDAFVTKLDLVAGPVPPEPLPPPPNPPPSSPPPPPPAPPPAPPTPPVVRPPWVVRCVVPNVKRKTVARARRLLASRRCALGRIKRAYSIRIKKGRIISQSRRPGTRLRRGTRVNVVVSRGRRPPVRR